MAIGGVEIPVILRVNRQAKRIIVKVDSLKRRVLLTCPSRSVQSEALAFARSRRGWIENQLEGGPVAVPFVADARIPFRGVPTQITCAASATGTVRYDPIRQAILTGAAAPGDVNDRISRWLKREARRVFHHEVRRFCTDLDVHYSKLSIRDTRTRWGSCSADGALSFSWRLILAPADVLSYVAAHEVAHLVHLDHSPAFWGVLDELTSTRKTSEAWLVTHGASLYGFGVVR